jgi:16S rRNA (guanine527-N7)-methyltransferase
VGHIRVLAELCLPFARVGGLVVAPKGIDADREAKEAQRALEVLGGRLVEVIRIELPELPPDRRIVVMEKTAPTPQDYPRRAGIPAKAPL